MTRHDTRAVVVWVGVGLFILASFTASLLVYGFVAALVAAG